MIPIGSWGPALKFQMLSFGPRRILGDAYGASEPTVRSELRCEPERAAASSGAGTFLPRLLALLGAKLAQKFISWATPASQVVGVTLTDMRPHFRVSDLALVLQLVGRELRGDVDRATRHTELNPVSGFNAGLSTDALLAR